MISLSIVIPAYNEEQRLPATLDRVLAYAESRKWSFLEVLVVDDGSRDLTAATVIARSVTSPAIRLLRNEANRGKGYTVRHGMLAAQGEWLLFTDADLSAPIEDLDRLLEAVENTGAVIAIGSRALDRSLVSVHQSKARELSGRLFNLIMRVLTGLPFHDTQCGFKLYRRDAAREVFERQSLDGFSFDVEDLVIARQLGLKTVEVPVRWANVEGTKVNMISGLTAFSDLALILWRRRTGRYRR